MNDSGSASGWKRLGPAQRPAGQPYGAAHFTVSPFTRLARTHLFSAAGDAAITVALADSVFFSVSPTDARPRVLMALLLTMAPFAIVGPLIGPVIDRAKGGRRWMIIGTFVIRAFVALMMIRDLDTLLLFPEALVALVMGKAYHVAKSAVVPNTVESSEALVTANSKLALLSTLGGGLALAPAFLLSRFVGSEWTLVLAVLIFGLGSFVSWRIPSERIAEGPPLESELEELRTTGVLLGATAMSVVRGIVGFLTFFLAFTFRAEGIPKWHLGLVLALFSGGLLVGALAAPRIRKTYSEERIIEGALGLVILGGLIGLGAAGLLGAAITSLCVGAASASAKMAFDAVVQRDAPDTNQGSSFARFETRFQMFWVIGAFIPVAITLPDRVGFLFITLAAIAALGVYFVGHRTGSAQPWRDPNRPRKPRRRVGARPEAAPEPSSDAPSSSTSAPPPSANGAAPAPPPGSPPPPPARAEQEWAANTPATPYDHPTPPRPNRQARWDGTEKLPIVPRMQPGQPSQPAVDPADITEPIPGARPPGRRRRKS